VTSIVSNSLLQGLVLDLCVSVVFIVLMLISIEGTYRIALKFRGSKFSRINLASFAKLFQRNF